MTSLMELDRPVQPPFPDVRYWTENYCVSGYDPKSGVGLWLHIGRWLVDPSIWREVVILRLPDGTVAAHRAFGKALTDADTAGGANFAFTVLEDKRRFALRFDGGIRRVVEAELAGGLLRDGPMERLHFELIFESNHPIWDMVGVSHTQDFAGTAHIEQTGHITGRIELGRDRYEYDGFGHRDHSHGPRDASNLSAHHWIQGVFEDGRRFALYDSVLRGATATAFSKAVVYDGGDLYPATLDLPFRIGHVDDARTPFRILLGYGEGRRLDIDVIAIPNTAFLSFSAPNEDYVGVFPSGKDGEPSETLLEQSGVYRLADGTMGHGPIERSVHGALHIEQPWD